VSRSCRAGQFLSQCKNLSLREDCVSTGIHISKALWRLFMLHQLATGAFTALIYRTHLKLAVCQADALN
jgi:hypothetical protein